MELWVDMINSTNFEKVFYFSLAVLFSFLSSWYYQSLIHIPFNKDIVFGSIITGCGIFIFVFATFWWSFPSAILSGIFGGSFFH